jgi:class 3 adenylate cyclase
MLSDRPSTTGRVGGVLEQAVAILFPTTLLSLTPWHDKWLEQERRESVVLWRSFFPIVAAVYLGHYYLFDRPMGLKPESLWYAFRMSIAVLSIATAAVYFVPIVQRSKYYRVPVTAMLLLLCYTQARTMVWYLPSQYLYAFVYVVVSAMLLRTSMPKSIAFAGVAMACQWPSFVEAGLPRTAVLCGIAAALIFVTITRSKYASDVRLFLANEMNVDAQRRMIEMNVDFTDRVRAFLPREISTRLNERLADSRLTVFQAVDEVLRPTQTPVACLFFDIRGSMPQPGVSDAAKESHANSSVTICNIILERNHGIPRKIGDLLFAYFDNPNPYVNLVRCVCSGLEISQTTHRQDQLEPFESVTKRHILISNGIAVVGNLGGYDSSIEITALGSPVNLLSRIDEVTRTSKFNGIARETDVILCPDTSRLLSHLALGVTMTSIDIWALGVRIRDFEEMQHVWILPNTPENRQMMTAAREYIDTVTTSLMARN